LTLPFFHNKQPKKYSDSETEIIERLADMKQDHLKKLYVLSIKSMGQIPQLDYSTYEQKKWIVFRLTHSNTWSKVHENKIGDWKNWR
jgi:hypothetical protein